MVPYKTICITGGAGFVGSNISIAFKNRFPKIRVIALDNLKRRGSELNLPRLKKSGVEFHHGDIRIPEDLKCLPPFDCMVECSAEPSAFAGFDQAPDYLLQTNLTGTTHCLEAARKNRAHFFFLSTSRVYPIQTINALKVNETPTRFDLSGNDKITGATDRGISETFSLEGTRTLYGATKLASELLVQEYQDMYAMPGIINRLGVLTGPWQMGKVDQGFVSLWAARHLFDGELSYRGFGGKGKQVRDILHIDDLFELLCLQMKNIEKYQGQIFNAGGGKDVSISLCELTALCSELTGKTIKIAEEPETRKGDIPIYITDNTKVQSQTGWQPRKDVPTILKDIIGWIQSNETELRSVFT